MASLIAAIISLGKVVPIVSDMIKALIAAYMSSVQNETLKEIADAAAMGARAKTEAERYEATDAWHSALNRARWM